MSMNALNIQPLSENYKFGRDDDQILALKYENICDVEYLNRLCSIDLSNSANVDHGLQYSNWMITDDIPEDILLFGDADELGREFFIKKSLNDIQYKLSDSLSILTNRQIRLYQHSAEVVIKRCSKKLLMEPKVNEKSSKCIFESMILS